MKTSNPLNPFELAAIFASAIVAAHLYLQVDMIMAVQTAVDNSKKHAVEHTKKLDLDVSWRETRFAAIKSIQKSYQNLVDSHDRWRAFETSRKYGNITPLMAADWKDTEIQNEDRKLNVELSREAMENYDKAVASGSPQQIALAKKRQELVLNAYF